VFAFHIRVVLVVRRSILLPMIHTHSFCGVGRITVFLFEQYPLDTVNVHPFILHLNAFIRKLSFATASPALPLLMQARPFALLQ
jgi:hypothetical protein